MVTEPVNLQKVCQRFFFFLKLAKLVLPHAGMDNTPAKILKMLRDQ